MDNNLRKLSELIDEILANGKYFTEYKSICDFISEEKQCVDFMNKQLKEIAFEEQNENLKTYKLAQNRAKHSVITYFMGLIFKQFGGIFDKIDDHEELWLKTSMYHDYGYYSDYVLKSDVDLKKESHKRYLLTDDYAAALNVLNKINYSKELAYTYKQIEQYFEYSRVYHFLKNSDEKVDHGILGGVLTFSRLSGKLVKNNLDEINRLKKFCLVIVQHNIFRIDNRYITRYKELSKDKHIVGYENCLDGLTEKDIEKISKVEITEKTPLLLFLCLVDTVECVKKFCSNGKRSKNFITRIVLDNLYLSVERDKIILDFSKLRERAQKDSKEKFFWFNETFCKYASGVESLSTWTVLDGICDGNRLTIQKRDFS